MVSGGLVAVTQNCIIEKLGKSGERTIQSCFPGGPPVGVFKNECDVLGREFADAGIEKKSFVVENESGFK
jgi:hypothetical protein